METARVLFCRASMLPTGILKIQILFWYYCLMEIRVIYRVIYLEKPGRDNTSAANKNLDIKVLETLAKPGA